MELSRDKVREALEEMQVKIAENDQRRIQQCQAEIAEVIKKYKCELVPQIVFNPLPLGPDEVLEMFDDFQEYAD